MLPAEAPGPFERPLPPSNGPEESAVRFKYETHEFGDIDIHVRALRDKQQFADEYRVAERIGISSAQWSLFGIVWDSAKVLAHQMAKRDVEGLRILEVGCGIGLTSLLLNRRRADITASDLHPEAGPFLRENARLNEDHRIPFVRASWADEESGMGTFDLIVGSDILYEREHVDLLAGFIDRHANPSCEVILVDPGRKHHARFSKRMVTLGYSHAQESPSGTEEYLAKPFGGQLLTYSRG